MMRRMIVVSVCVLFFGVASLNPGVSSARTTETTRGEKAKGGEVKAPKNNSQKAVEAPPSKGGKKTRGRYCRIHVDNRSRWIILLQVNSDYSGSISPYGDVYDTVVSDSGRFTLLGLAEFDDPSDDLIWGPKTTSCPGGEYTWQLK